ncbi:hypothetical protein F4553_003967 [Allocatelliglobosispora scoriae]|uniref:DUF5919 domain-containing protein n=1 Tax=Allocatelliglobosispora scoriae TaxID=643052 RepID=A0A841BT50_9ACTN|nr:DUF5919 domain-containing protein [Allocatelliglobosispora scoriae]MBB5870588.1 hypothetical protein [Allocatelliglobosispora scoriae]
MSGEPGKIIDLNTRKRFKPDVGALAREQVSQARQRLGLSRPDFAERLEPLIGWLPSPEVIESWETAVVPPGDVLMAANLAMHGSVPVQSSRHETDLIGQAMADRFADVTAVFATRSEFVSAMPPHRLFDQATEIRAAGLSLNILCQNYTDSRLRDLVQGGTRLKFLFLDPAGTAIAQREQEEGYPPGHLSSLTELNIQTVMYRVRDRLPVDLRPNVEIATYDETVRFNIIMIDSDVAVVQPYLPEARGIDSPTLVLNRRSSVAGLYPMFEQVFNVLWERGQPL